jgi:hypothetical protein
LSVVFKISRGDGGRVELKIDFDVVARGLRGEPRIGPIGMIEPVAVARVGHEEPKLVHARDIDIHILASVCASKNATVV